MIYIVWANWKERIRCNISLRSQWSFHIISPQQKHLYYVLVFFLSLWYHENSTTFLKLNENVLNLKAVFDTDSKWKSPGRHHGNRRCGSVLIYIRLNWNFLKLENSWNRVANTLLTYIHRVNRTLILCQWPGPPDYLISCRSCSQLESRYDSDSWGNVMLTAQKTANSSTDTFSNSYSFQFPSRSYLKQILKIIRTQRKGAAYSTETCLCDEDLPQLHWRICLPVFFISGFFVQTFQAFTK